jgi:hypothetical protein
MNTLFKKMSQEDMDTLNWIIKGRAHVINEDLAMFRCLGFANSMTEVSMWPVWVCSMDVVKEALDKGWLYELRKDTLHTRLCLSTVVYGLTPTGSNEFISLTYKNSPAVPTPRTNRTNDKP